MKLLVDTNVLLSAALRDRLPERVVLQIASRDDWIWLVTSQILLEYVDVLRRPKFKLSNDVLVRWSELLEMRTVLVPSQHVSQAVDFPRDPKDVPFLAASLAYDVEWLVTGDRDLLAVQAHVTTRIVTASQFAAEFQITE